MEIMLFHQHQPSCRSFLIHDSRTFYYLLWSMTIFCSTEVHCMVTPGTLRNTTQYFTGSPTSRSSSIIENKLSTWETAFVCIGILMVMITIAIIGAWIANKRSQIISQTTRNKSGYESFGSDFL